VTPMTAANRDILGLSVYRVRGRGPGSGGCDILAADDGEVLGVASPGGAGGGRMRRLLAYRVCRYPAIAFAVVATPLWLAGVILRLWPWEPRSLRPRLIARGADGREILTLRVASGLMYDSRRVYDGRGRLVAHFRSGGKASVRRGFEIIDLRGREDDDPDIGECPSLGRVEAAGGAYTLRLGDDPSAGRITPRDGDGSHDVEASPGLADAAAGPLLLLAAALTLAWSPPA